MNPWIWALLLGQFKDESLIWAYENKIKIRVKTGKTAAPFALSALLCRASGSH
jgi:hypothetical protein